MTTAQTAAKYGLTIEELRAEATAYIQSEGYDEHGREYPTLADWLRRDHRDPNPDRTPWQKGDDYPA